MFQKILLELQLPWHSGRSKIMNSKANLVSSSRGVSGELSISQSNIFHHFHNLSKSIWSFWIVPHIIKILQNFWLTLVEYTIYIYSTPSTLGRMWQKVLFFKLSKAGFNSVFLPNQGLRIQSALLFNYSWRKNRWIHAFPKGISTKWNVNSLKPKLNFGC